MTVSTPTSASAAPAPPATQHQLSIGGRWAPATEERTFTVDNPATGAPLAHVADATPADAQRAVRAAEEARTAIAALSPRRRGDILLALERAVRDREEDFTTLITLEMGKPLEEARAEVRYAADFLRWFAEEAARIGGDYRESPDGASHFLVSRDPIGPCLLITPWNFPLAMAVRKVAPALAAGCPLVLKPAEETPLTTLLFAQIAGEVGLPDGAVNVVTTSDPAAVVQAMLASGAVRMLSFTGSTAVGKQLLHQAADGVLRTSLELGGNAPFLVFADADLDAAVEGAVVAKLRNGGQACTAANRFLVAEPVAAEFGERLADRFARIAVGPGWQPGVELGPMINDAAVGKVRALVEDATGRGASVATGGSSTEDGPRFYRPTVLTQVDPDSHLLHEEIFGPVAPITTFGDEAAAIRIANATPYGLVAYLYTSDIDRAFRVSRALDVGMVGLNRGLVSNAAAPFGGTKESGLGREGGHDGIEEYLETKYLAITTPGR